jgi:hypothetical protein
MVWINRKPSLFFIIFYLGMSIFLGGCSEREELSTPTFSPSETPSETATPTATRTATLTLTPTITPSPTATFGEEAWKRQSEIILRMANQEFPDCRFPCWWGITPGVTSWEVTKDFFLKNGLAMLEYRGNDYYRTGILMYGVYGQFILSDDMAWLDNDFYVLNGMIHHINIGGYYVPRGGNWKNIWPSLSPDKLIPELGMPSRVQINGGCGGVEAPTINDCDFGLFIFYDEQGIYLHYDFFTDAGIGSAICPSFDRNGGGENWFKIILKSPQDPTPIEEYDVAYGDAMIYEKATGKTVQDFYQLFLQSKKPPCFFVLPEPFTP